MNGGNKISVFTGVANYQNHDQRLRRASMRKYAFSAVIAAGIGCTALGLAACQQKQSSGQKIKQGAQEIGQGIKQGTSETGQFLSDSTITVEIKSKLAANQGLSSFGIHVETNKGVVTLSGSMNYPRQPYGMA